MRDRSTERAGSTAWALAAYLLVAGAWLALAGGAVAAPGQLSYDGCLANGGADGCVDLPGAPLDAAFGVAVSPDGRSVYSAGGDAVAHFFRGGPAGQLFYDGCLGNSAAGGCGALPQAPLDGAFGVAASADGKSVYVASSRSNSIAHFVRGGPDGQLFWDGCLGSDATHACLDLPARPLDGASGVAVSPDGRSVYVASLTSASIAHFFRSGADGRLAYDGCLANDGSQGCVDLPGTPLGGAAAVAVSPDGRSVYVAAGDAIAHFFRSGPDGQIFYDGCLASSAADGCIDLPGAPLDSAGAVAVSPDGRSVYVASAGSDSVAHFFRSGPDGQIFYDGCLNNDGSDGCVDLPGAPLDLARGVAVSPDGSSVYVASQGGDSIAHFLRAVPDGQLFYDGCLANTAADRCLDLPAAPLDDAYGVAVSPDGRSVYVVSAGSDSIAHFFRELAPPAPRPTPPTPGQVAPPPAGAGPSSTAPLRFGARTRVTLELSIGRIRARGPVTVAVSNDNGFTVRGRLSGEVMRRVSVAGGTKRRVRLKARAFEVAAKATTTVELTLPRKLRRLLAHRGELPLRVTANVEDPAGTTRTTTERGTLRLNKDAGRGSRR